MFASKDLFFSKPSGYQISRSVRFRSSATAYFNRTPASSGSRKTWTWSGWVKRGALSSSQTLFSGYVDANNKTRINFSSADVLQVYDITGGATERVKVYSTQVFRDPSAWYHILVAMDTTQATASDRTKVYINGNQITAFGTATYPTQNTDLFINATNAHRIGADGDPLYFDGYLTEVNFIDGQALTPSSFGQTNTITGVWQPLKYTGTYGTNGFYLNFSDNSNNTATTIGKDYSSNGNNWTPNNISVTSGVTYDSMLDVPTPYADGGNGRGNYCVLNRLDADTIAVSTSITNGNLTASGTTYGATVYTCSMQIPQTGKWYWEVVYSTITNTIALGVRSSSTGSTDVQYYSNGNKNVGGTTTAYGATWTTSDIIACAVDRDAGTVTWYKNNVSQGAINIPTNSAIFDIAFNVLSPYGSTTFNANFGQRPFTYTPPTGFVALNTQNLPTPTISNGANYMAATTYSGDGTNPRTITNSVNNIGFQPDFIWAKVRSTTYSNTLYDSVRGGANALFSDTTSAESTNYANGQILAFNSNGFNVNAGVVLNQSGQTYVTWQWKAGTTSSSNTSGSITSTVSAGATQGFSVVTYTGTGANATVGHGLGVAPKMVIVKERNAVRGWPVYHASLTSATYYVDLQTTAAQASAATIWNSTAPSSTVFSIGTDTGTNQSTGTYVAYCFSEVAGYSKFGSYTGNGSADGAFVFCGFRPRYVLLKRSDTADAWVVFDSVRGTYNLNSPHLQPHLSSAEADAPPYGLDFLSNGFKCRSSTASMNASGGTYIFMAFAENPTKFSLAR
jgi:hypothetical protein